MIYLKDTPDSVMMYEQQMRNVMKFDIPSGAVVDEDDIQELIDQFKLWADDLDSGVIPEIHLTMYEIGTVIEALHTLRREKEET